ncbi:hypothetical protein [Streptomyces sp. NBC_00645]|uniref:hypothetical protein n=1 Tax=Streptomyces sp. NBC_00645 TaxID=2975795 RepID=UPI003255F479
MIDIVQKVGQALRMQTGTGKLATLIVPVFLGPDEDPNEMLTSNSLNTLTKVLGALRAHDTETIEALADPGSATAVSDSNKMMGRASSRVRVRTASKSWALPGLRICCTP